MSISSHESDLSREIHFANFPEDWDNANNPIHVIVNNNCHTTDNTYNYLKSNSTRMLISSIKRIIIIEDVGDESECSSIESSESCKSEGVVPLLSYNFNITPLL